MLARFVVSFPLFSFLIALFSSFLFFLIVSLLKLPGPVLVIWKKKTKMNRRFRKEKQKTSPLTTLFFLTFKRRWKGRSPLSRLPLATHFFTGNNWKPRQEASIWDFRNQNEKRDFRVSLSVLVCFIVIVGLPCVENSFKILMLFFFCNV